MRLLLQLLILRMLLQYTQARTHTHTHTFSLIAETMDIHEKIFNLIITSFFGRNNEKSSTF